MWSVDSAGADLVRSARQASLCGHICFFLQETANPVPVASIAAAERTDFIRTEARAHSAVCIVWIGRTRPQDAVVTLAAEALIPVASKGAFKGAI